MTAPSPGSYADRARAFKDLHNEPPVDPAAVHAFGPPEEITVGQLRVGDFVVEIPTQGGILGVKVNSAVTSTTVDYDRYKMSTGYRRPRVSVTSRRLTFAAVPTGHYWPDSFTCTVRRPEPTS